MFYKEYSVTSRHICCSWRWVRKMAWIYLVVRGQECCWLPFRTWNSTYCKLQKSVMQWLWWKAEAGLILIYNVSCRISSVFQYHSKQVSISSASIFAWYIMKSQPIIYFLLLFIWFTQYSLLIAFIICTLSCTCAHTCTHLCMLAFECLTGMNEVPSGESGCGRCWGDATGPRPCFSWELTSGLRDEAATVVASLLRISLSSAALWGRTRDSPGLP